MIVPVYPTRSFHHLRQAQVRWLTSFAVLTVAVVSVVPWRTGDIYNGGADPIVVAKAVVGILGLAGSFLYFLTSSERRRIGIRSLALFAGIVVISAIGALATGDASAALVLTVRIALVAATIVVMVRSAPPRVVLTGLLAAMSAVAIVAAVTGFQHGLDDGRLAGGIPQMAPNVLAGLAAPPAIGLVADILHRGLRPWNVLLLLAHVIIVFETESRTALIVIVIGAAVAFACGGRPAPSAAVAAIAAIPLGYALAVFTNTLSALLERGQTAEQLSTLSSRTVAWQAVFATPYDSWAKWIGVGLAAKTVAVQQQYRDVQVLDSSWVSVIAQAGIIGTTLLIIWIVWTSIESLRTRTLTAFTTPLMVMLLIRSFTENGLIESSTTFMLFLVISITLEPGSEKILPPAQRYQLAVPLPANHREGSRT